MSGKNIGLVPKNPGCAHGFPVGFRQESANFFVKGQRGNIFGFEGCAVSAATIQLCCCSVKAATGNARTKEWDSLVNSNGKM